MTAGWDQSAFAQALADERAAEARRGGRNVYPIRSEIGVDDWERPPDSRYEDEVEPMTGNGPMMAGASAKAIFKAFSFARVGDLDLTEPEYLVDGMVETETVGVFFGDPGCGKSFLAVGLACSVASGVDFQSRKVRQGSVFYIAGEGHKGLSRRFHAWAKHYGHDIGRLPIFTSNRAAQLLDRASAQEVERAVLDMSAKYGDPALIFIDTLARNFGAGDENSTQDMSGFIAAIDDLRANWPKTTIIIVHHSGHSDKGRGRGNTALKGALDFEFGLSKDGDTVTLTNPKMKDAPELPDQFFRLADVELGPRIRSAVLIAADAPAKRQKQPKGQQLIALQAFGDALAEHGVKRIGSEFPADRQCVSLDHWRIVCDRHSLTDGTSDSASRQAFGRAWKALQEAGFIRVIDGFAWRCGDA